MMFRLRSLITRAAILFLIVAAIWIGRDPLTRKALIASGESIVGARIEIGRVRTSFRDNRVFLKHLAIADPRDPMKNLFQADSATLQLNLASLMQRRFVVEDGTASRIVFGTPRSKSGRIGSLPEPAAEPPRPTVSVEQAGRDLRADWLDRFQHVGPLLDPSQAEVSQAFESLFKRWDADLQKQLASINGLKSNLRQIHDLIPQDANPLRETRLQYAKSQVAGLQHEIDSIQSRLAELDQQLADDRNVLFKAKQSDEKRIIAKTLLRSLDGEVVTRLLLNRHQSEQAAEILDWFYAFQSSVPDPRREFLPVNEIGKSLQLGQAPLADPDFLIRKIQLDGEGRLAGIKFNFSGTARNISSQPELLDEPVTFELRAQGNAHAVVNCTLDRSTEFRNDSICINCPNLPTPARTLGDRESLLVNVSPCRTDVVVSLRCHNGQISGEFKFNHSNLVMQIEYLDPLAGGQEVADRINLELATVSVYKINATISGPVGSPLIRFQSDLGDRLAEKFNETIEQQSRIAQNQLNGIFADQMAKLEQEVKTEVRNAATLLKNEIVDRQTAFVSELDRQVPVDPLKRSLQR